MNVPIFIAFGNKARQGKGTAARVIHEAFPRETKVYGFSDAVYTLCRLRGMRGKDAPMLQQVGEAYRQPGTLIIDEQHVQTHPNFWVDLLLDRIAFDRPAVALIEDMRHANEAAVCHYRVRVTRTAINGKPWFAPDRDPAHISETALDDYAGWTHRLTNVENHQGKFASDVLDMYRAIRRTHGL